jgi:hypothetical protein
MKKLFVLLSALVILTISSLVSAGQYDVLIQGIKGKSLDKYILEEGTYPGTTIPMTTYLRNENTADHDNFPWSWNKHELGVLFSPQTGDVIGIIFARAEYHELITADSRQIIVYVLSDFDLDGIIDQKHKDYILVMQNSNLIFPYWPEGFRNMDWYKMSDEDVKKLLEEEIKFWESFSGRDV